MLEENFRASECIDFLNNQCQMIQANQYKVSFKDFVEFARKQEWLYSGLTNVEHIEIDDIMWHEAEEEFDAILTVRPNTGDMMIILN